MLSRKNSLIIVVIIMLVASFAFGAEFTITPSFSVSEQYNDNVFFSRRDKKDDYITILSPSLSLTSRTEKSFLEAQGTLEWRDYGKLDKLDFLTQRYNAQGRYSIDPKTGVFGSVGMIKDYSPDRDLTETGLVTKAIKRNRYLGSIGAQKTFMEKTRGDITLEYERTEYAHDPEYADYNSYGGNIAIIHTITPRVSGRASVGYSFFEQRRVENDYYYGMVGIGYSLEERWNLYIDAGISYLKTELELTPTTKREKKGTGWVGRSVLSYRGEKETIDFTFYRRMTPATGVYGVSERNFFSVDISHRLTYEFSLGLGISYITNRAKKGEYALSEQDERSFLLTPRLRYNFNRNMFIEGSYSYSRLRDNVAHETAKRNLFMVRFTIRHPIERGI